MADVYTSIGSRQIEDSYKAWLLLFLPPELSSVAQYTNPLLIKFCTLYITTIIFSQNNMSKDDGVISLLINESCLINYLTPTPRHPFS